MVGLPDIWLTGWLRGPHGRRDLPLKIMGPEGTENLMEHLQLAYAWDVDTRVEDQKMSREAAMVVAENVTPGVIYDQDGVTITAFSNNHGELIDPSLGYRVDYDGHAVVISGDIRKVQSVIDAATGVHLLVHSIGAARQELLESAPIWRRIMDHHIEPEDAGRVFTHVVSLTDGKIPPVSDDELIERTLSTYDGPLLMEQDLMTKMIGPDEVTAGPWQL
ncbi:MAG: hypothetical protein ACR2P3_14990 [Geminicoccaceae bacterium]